MCLIEYVSPIGSGKTSTVNYILKRKKNIYPGKKNLIKTGNILNYKKLILENFTHFVGGSLRDFLLLFKFMLNFSSSLKEFFKCLITFYFLLVHTRLLVNSKKFYIIDQGLNQFILTCVSLNYISLETGKKWKKILMNDKLYSPIKLRSIKNINYEIIKDRILLSKKHNLHSKMSNKFILDQIKYHKEIYV